MKNIATQEVKKEAKREVVWQINSNLKKETTTRSKSKSSKEPVLVKTLIEKTFNKLSAQLLERLGALEQELKTLQAENAELKNKLTQVQNLG